MSFQIIYKFQKFRIEFSLLDFFIFVFTTIIYKKFSLYETWSIYYNHLHIIFDTICVQCPVNESFDIAFIISHLSKNANELSFVCKIIQRSKSREKNITK